MSREGARKAAATSAVAAILLLPSLWLMLTVPPLWRDRDAYVQLTREPGATTILGHGVLYCFTARVPLYIGYKVDQLRGLAEPLQANFFVQPQLTNSGIFLLVAMQHAALWAAAAYFIFALSPRSSVRLVFAALWAAIPLFYTFAHCLGSETLSMILTVLVAGAGLRIAQSRQALHWKQYLLFAGLCWLAILTRHVNHLLVFVLPLALLIGAALSSVAIPFRLRPGDVLAARTMALLRGALITVLVAVGVLVAANLSTRLFAKLADEKYRARIGYTFLWRLQFLEALSDEDRARVLEQASRGTKSPEAQRLIAMLGETYAGEAPLRASSFARDARAVFLPDKGRRAGYKLDLALNAMTRGFLNPPHPLYLAAVSRDLRNARLTALATIPASLFETTTYFFTNRETMPQLAGLVTFRDYSADQIRSIAANTSYFAIGSRWTYERALLLWVVLLGVVLLGARARYEALAPVIGYAIALTSVGMLMMVSSSLFGEYLPRYTMPMWLLLVLSSFIIAAELPAAFSVAKERWRTRAFSDT